MSEHDYGNMTIATAQEQIDGILRDSEDVYHAPLHTPGRDTRMEHIGMLFKVTSGELNTAAPAGDLPISHRGFSTETRKVMEEGLELQEEKQQARVEEATALRDELVKDFDFESVAVEKDIPAWKIRCWQTQKSLAKKDYAAVAASLRKELMLLKAPTDRMTMLDNLNMPDGVPESHRETGYRDMMVWVAEESKRKAVGIAATVKSMGG